MYAPAYPHVAAGESLVSSLWGLQFLFLLLPGTLCASYKDSLPERGENPHFQGTGRVVFSAGT
jgi:hypothetical protein